MSQLADVNTQSTVGMFHFYDVLRCFDVLHCKVFAHIILARIKPTLLSHRRPQQSGFTPGRSTCDRIATLCNIAQWRQDFGRPTFAAFVYLGAAFDSLRRPAL